jgi:glucose/arabinose dehydrogenase
MSLAKKSSSLNWPMAALLAGLVGTMGLGCGSNAGSGGGEGGGEGDGTGGNVDAKGGSGGMKTGGKGGSPGTGGTVSAGGSGPAAGGDTGSGGATSPDAGGPGTGGDTGSGGSGPGSGGDTSSGGSGPGSGGDTGSGGATMGTGGTTGGTALVPCSTDPAMQAPMLKKTLIGNVSGQPGEVIGVPGENILYVVSHKTGNVFILQDGKPAPLADPLAKVTVATGGNDEQGLLSIALHPDFAKNHLFYVLYTAANSDITIDEFERLTPTTSMKKQTIWDKPRAAGGEFHNGGMLFFNPKDGVAKPILYHSVGNNLSNQAGQATGVAGRVLAHDLSNGMASTFAYGLRNPYRMSIDRQTGDMWIGDVSNASGGSVFFNAAGKTGTNFGYTTNGGPEVAGGISGHDGSSGAMIGGIVYRGNKIPEICGRYFYGMWKSGNVKSLLQQGGKAAGMQAHTELTVAALSSFGEDGDGEIIMSSQNGQIYRLEK